MNFDLSDEAKHLRDEARRFVAAQSSLSAVRALAASGAAHDAALWARVADLGWPAAAVPEAHGGVGMGYEALCVLAEQAGAALLPVPFSATCAAIEAISLAGDETQKRHWIPQLTSGARIGAVALAEGGGNPDPRLIEARVLRGRLSGTKAPVADGTLADIFVVAAQFQNDVGLFVVERDAATVRSVGLATLDIGRGHASIGFDGAIAERLHGGGGWQQVQHLLDRLAIVTAFEQLGGACACLDMAVAHAKQRLAFGRPIGSFQAVKHKLAELYIAVELARSNAYYGAWSLTNRQNEAVAAACARISATEAFEAAARENIHVHGGQGFTWEQDCHLYFRRSRMLASALGTTAFWKTRLMDTIDDSAAELGRGHGF